MRKVFNRNVLYGWRDSFHKYLPKVASAVGVKKPYMHPTTEEPPFKISTKDLKIIEKEVRKINKKIATTNKSNKANVNKAKKIGENIESKLLNKIVIPSFLKVGFEFKNDIESSKENSQAIETFFSDLIGYHKVSIGMPLYSKLRNIEAQFQKYFENQLNQTQGTIINPEIPQIISQTDTSTGQEINGQEINGQEINGQEIKNEYEKQGVVFRQHNTKLNSRNMQSILNTLDSESSVLSPGSGSGSTGRGSFDLNYFNSFNEDMMNDLTSQSQKSNIPPAPPMEGLKSFKLGDSSKSLSMQNSEKKTKQANQLNSNLLDDLNKDNIRNLKKINPDDINGSNKGDREKLLNDIQKFQFKKNNGSNSNDTTDTVEQNQRQSTISSNAKVFQNEQTNRMLEIAAAKNINIRNSQDFDRNDSEWENQTTNTKPTIVPEPNLLKSNDIDEKLQKQIRNANVADDTHNTLKIIKHAVRQTGKTPPSKYRNITQTTDFKKLEASESLKITHSALTSDLLDVTEIKPILNKSSSTGDFSTHDNSSDSMEFLKHNIDIRRKNFDTDDWNLADDDEDDLYFGDDEKNLKNTTQKVQKEYNKEYQNNKSKIQELLVKGKSDSFTKSLETNNKADNNKAI